MIFKNAYLSLFCAILVGIVVIFYGKPCVGEPPKIDCTVASRAVKQGEPIKVEVESDEQLKSLKVFLKQPQSKCIPIYVKREKRNKYVGHIDTFNLIPGEAVIKVYATDLDEKHAMDILAVQIK